MSEAVWDCEALGEGKPLGQGVGESVVVGVISKGEAEGEVVEK